MRVLSGHNGVIPTFECQLKHGARAAPRRKVNGVARACAFVQGHDRIETNPRVLEGKPVVRGTRISVQLLLDLVAEGVTFDEILASYPELTRPDIEAAVRYASALTGRVEGTEYGVV